MAVALCSAASARTPAFVIVYPSRFVDVDRARARFGDRVDRLGAYLLRADPLADAAVAALEPLPTGERKAVVRRGLERPLERVPGTPDALRALVDTVSRPPFWADLGLLDRAGRVLLRAGPLGGLVLGLKSLVLAYTSPAGNKPLVLTGRLKEQAPRRLRETADFVRQTILPGSMRPGAAGWRATIEVRLLHAHARRALVRSGRWREAEWGVPINQHDQAGTSLLFSAAVLEGLRQLGAGISADEASDYMQLWRWSGWLMGIDPELLVSTEREAARLADVIRATQAPPDADSRDLTRALLEAPMRSAVDDRQRRRAERAMRVSAALCRGLVGHQVADQLDIAHTPWRHTVPPVMAVVRALVSRLYRVREHVPLADRSATVAGQRYWERVAVAE